MANTDYKAIIKEFKMNELKINSAIKIISPETLTSEDLDNYDHSLREIKNLHEKFDDLFNDVQLGPEELDIYIVMLCIQHSNLIHIFHNQISCHELDECVSSICNYLETFYYTFHKENFCHRGVMGLSKISSSD